MTESTIPLSQDLVHEARKYFHIFAREFMEYGLEINPEMEIRASPNMQTYYDLSDGNIYVPSLDITTTSGKITKLFMRSVLHCENDDELFEFLMMFQPRVVAHEMAHHLRHRYGMFDRDNLWLEEQLANQLATAMTKHRMSPDRRERAKFFLKRAIEGLSQKLEVENIAVDSYHSVLYALYATGQIGEQTMDNIELMQRIFKINPNEMLRESGQLSNDLLVRLENRGDIIENINEEYTADFVKYMYYHVGWLYCDLMSHRRDYVDEFIKRYLKHGIELLPIIELKPYVDEWEIQACYKAYQDVFDHSETIRRYFYKRYRALLLAKFQQVRTASDEKKGDQFQREVALLLERWDEDDDDALNYLALLAPPRLRKIFPHLIADNIDAEITLPDSLPHETDRELWKYAKNLEENKLAQQTLHRLQLLDQTAIYRKLPVEVMLELAHLMYRVKIAPGDTIIWEGEKNDDVYILLEGELTVSVHQNGKRQYVGKIYQGDVVGEMAFFTQDARSATVSATQFSECLAIKEADLQLLTSRHPAILMQMARAIAKRLDKLNASIGLNKEPSYLDSILSRLTGN